LVGLVLVLLLGGKVGFGDGDGDGDGVVEAEGKW